MKRDYLGNSRYILFNGDSRKVLDALISKGIKVDMIFTDPPYRTSSRGNNGNSGGMLGKSLNLQGRVFEHNDIEVSEYASRLYKLLKDGGHCYIMTNHVNLIEMLNTFTDVRSDSEKLYKIKPYGFHFIKSLIWDKGNKIMGQYYMSQFEYILFFRKGDGRKINNCGTSDILSIPNKKSKAEDGSNLHDTEKPVELLDILISNSSNESGLVLDPFMGIGACGVSCSKLNRRFIGIELDKSYFDIAKKRLEDVERELNINENS